MPIDPKPIPHESDWVLICGHMGSLPIQMYVTGEDTPTAAKWKEDGVRVPDECPPGTPIHWMALCTDCGIMQAGTVLKLGNAIDPQLRRLKDLRDDGAYFSGRAN